MRPSSGLTKPSSALSIVLLPAPLGPSRPTAPAREFRADVFQRLVLAVDDGDVIELHDCGRAFAARCGSLVR